MTNRAMTLRIDEEQAEVLALIATIEAVSLATLLRRAVSQLIEEYNQDPDFRERARAHLSGQFQRFRT